ncbi:MAG TPA: Kazal-type serine protease inhibitor, partial [Flavobacteriales bacterium]|nr:Kazal-type serine protease inhibitor [Flavobacteriales bacterium]
MKTNSYQKNPKTFLGYLMALVMVLSFNVSVNAQCTASGAMCICPMIYMPVCGCDGVMYSNSCLANCQGVAYTPAVPNISGGFLPCPPPAPVGCTVGVTATATNATSATANDGTATATLVGPSSTCATTFLWSNGLTTAAITNLSPGNYMVYTTDCQGCVDSASVTVGIVSSGCV